MVFYAHLLGYFKPLKSFSQLVDMIYNRENPKIRKMCSTNIQVFEVAFWTTLPSYFVMLHSADIGNGSALSGWIFQGPTAPVPDQYRASNPIKFPFVQAQTALGGCPGGDPLRLLRLRMAKEIKSYKKWSPAAASTKQYFRLYFLAQTFV